MSVVERGDGDALRIMSLSIYSFNCNPRINECNLLKHGLNIHIIPQHIKSKYLSYHAHIKLKQNAFIILSNDANLPFPNNNTVTANIMVDINAINVVTKYLNVNLLNFCFSIPVSMKLHFDFELYDKLEI